MTVLRVTVQRGEGRTPLIAEFGGIPLRNQPVRQLDDRAYHVFTQQSDPVKRLLVQRCEMCRRRQDDLVDLGIQLPKSRAK
jgi:hypothetical protein